MSCIEEQVWVIGAGAIGREYIKVLKAQGVTPLLIKNRQAGAAELARTLEVEVYFGGVERAVKELPPPKKAIVATDIISTKAVTDVLLLHTPSNILVEKPVVLDKGALADLIKGDPLSRIIVALNRRYYQASKRAREFISEHEIRSVFVDVSERGNIVQTLPYDKEVIRNWATVNSIHVWDLLRLLLGDLEIEVTRKSKPGYHPFTCYSGLLKTKNDIPITFVADWNAPGDWAIDIRGAGSRFKLAPLEVGINTNFQTPGVEKFDYDKHDQFKPGFYDMVKCFLNGDGVNLSEYAKSFDLVRDLYY